MSEVTSFPVIALAGSPNCGKTALFNALTGSHQKVANFPGTTVEKKEGVFETASGSKIRILDLPGAYSLDPQSPDEVITRDVVTHAHPTASPDILVAVVDATSLERSLSFVLELRNLGRPLVLALNMMDLAAERGLKLDLPTLERELGVPVIPTVAVKKNGIQELVQSVEVMLKSMPASKLASHLKTSFSSVEARFAEVDRILGLATIAPAQPDRWTDRIDSVVLHPVWGILMLVVVLGIIFQAVFTWAAPFTNAIDNGMQWLGTWVGNILGEGPLKSLIVDGAIAGVGAVIVFLPQILILFAFILLLEDFGYMARAAFLMDRLMGKVGLHGRAFIPLLSSFACAIPGIMATRTIENPRDRLTTILIAPIMTCSARLPVYTLLIAAFIPNTAVVGPFRLQGLVMLALYVAGVVGALAIAFLLKRTLLKGEQPPFLLELPSYKVPHFKNLAIGLRMRSMMFVKRAGTIILSLSILLWFLSSYPVHSMKEAEARGEPAIKGSYAGRLGQMIEPVLAPIGFDWRMSIALIPGFAAREVMVSALSTVYALDDQGEAEAQLTDRLQRDWSLPVALSVLMWYVFAPQCLSTLAVTRRETNSWRWPIFMMIYLLVLAYGSSFLVYRLSQLWV